MHKIFNKKKDHTVKREPALKNENTQKTDITATMKKDISSMKDPTPKEKMTRHKDSNDTSYPCADLETEEYWTWLCCRVSPKFQRRHHLVTDSS